MHKIAKMVALSLVLTGGASAAAPVVLYTGPVKENVVDGVVQRVSCDVLNLDKKTQTVTADVMWADGSVLNSKTADLGPGQASYHLAVWSGATGNLYCRFTVKTKKVRGYINLYNSNWTFLFTQEAY